MLVPRHVILSENFYEVKIVVEESRGAKYTHRYKRVYKVITRKTQYITEENPQDFLPYSHRGLGVTPSRWEVKGVFKGERNIRNGSFFPLGGIK